MSVTFSDIWDHIKKNGFEPIDEISKLIIRPPRADYKLTALGPQIFRIQSGNDPNGKPCTQAFKRYDLTLENMRGLNIECSWYRPYDAARERKRKERQEERLKRKQQEKEKEENQNDDDDDDKQEKEEEQQENDDEDDDDLNEKPMPVVIYLHGNSGSRLDAQECLYLLEHGVTLFTYDATGSGVSGGDYVTLGIYERQDLAAVVEYLRSLKPKLVTTIGLWGRSMGSVTSIMYARRDPSISVLILDSPFSTLKILVADLVEQHAAWAPNFAIDAIVDKVRRRIIRRAGFDINDLDTIAAASECDVPAFIFHGKDDTFVRPVHSEMVAEIYRGSCLRHEVEGGHNDERLSDARDVALSLIKLYLIDKPQAANDRARARLEKGNHIQNTNNTNTNISNEKDKDKLVSPSLLSTQVVAEFQKEEEQRQRKVMTERAKQDKDNDDDDAVAVDLGAPAAKTPKLADVLISSPQQNKAKEKHSEQQKVFDDVDLDSAVAAAF